jgi:hypothetical protein
MRCAPGKPGYNKAAASRRTHMECENLLSLS